MKKQTSKATMNGTTLTKVTKSKNMYVYRADDFAEIQQLLENHLKDRYAFGKRAKSTTVELRKAIRRLMNR